MFWVGLVRFVYVAFVCMLKYECICCVYVYVLEGYVCVCVSSYVALIYECAVRKEDGDTEAVREFKSVPEKG